MCDASDILDPFGVVEKTKDTVSEWTKDQGLYSFAAPMVDPFSQEGIVNSTGLPAMRKYIEKQTQLGQWTGDIGIDDLEQYFIEQGIDPDLALSTLIAGGSYASTLIPAAAPAAPIAPELAPALAPAVAPALAPALAPAIAPALAPAVAPSVGKALWELGKAALPAAIGAGTSLYLGAKGQDAATDAANIQAQGIQKGIDAQLEMFYAGLDMTKPFAEVQLAATKRAEEAIIAGAPQRTPYEGGELENFLLDRGDREAQRYLSKTGQIGSGRAIEEAVRRGEVAALAGRETHTQEQTNAINDWLSTKVNPDLALGGGGQVAQNQSSASQRAGEVQSQGYAGIGEAQAGGRISGYNALSGGYMGAANAVQSYFNPDPSREFYNALLDRMK